MMKYTLYAAAILLLISGCGRKEEPAQKMVAQETPVETPVQEVSQQEPQEEGEIAEEESAEMVKATEIIDFSAMVQDKNPEEMRAAFAQEIQNDGITIVKFSASWCGPCKMYVPVFEEVASEFREAGSDDASLPIKYMAVDIDKAEVIAQDYQVDSVPTTIFYQSGQQVATERGVLQKDQIISMVQELVMQ